MDSTLTPSARRERTDASFELRVSLLDLLLAARRQVGSAGTGPYHQKISSKVDDVGERRAEQEQSALGLDLFGSEANDGIPFCSSLFLFFPSFFPLPTTPLPIYPPSSSQHVDSPGRTTTTHRHRRRLRRRNFNLFSKFSPRRSSPLLPSRHPLSHQSNVPLSLLRARSGLEIRSSSVRPRMWSWGWEGRGKGRMGRMVVRVWFSFGRRV